MRFKNLKIFLLLLLVLPQMGCEENTVDTSAALEEVFLNAEQLPNLKSLIVYKDNSIIKEKYFHNGAADIEHDVRSVTKSVMSTLIGIAIDNGFIQSEDQTIDVFLEPLVGNLDSAKSKIRIRDLLSMSSGFYSNELASSSEYNNWISAPNQLLYTLSQPLVSQPGQTFYYNSGASHLLSIILTQATGMSSYNFAKQYLFQPLGISEHNWSTDKQGLNNGAAGLRLTPKDMLKIGILYLNGGIYNNTQVVPRSWITKATTAKITTGTVIPFASDYGYLWWNGRAHSRNYYFANGWGGQFIVVVPEHSLIVVASNEWSGIPSAIAGEQWYNTLNLIINEIIPIYN
jgi:CubicO group peptidase (beta-lactamase class C family)